MSGLLAGPTAVCGIGKNTEPTLEESTKATKAGMERIIGAWQRYMAAKDDESAAYRAQVLASLAGEFMGAAYNLQRAAYDKATK